MATRRSTPTRTNAEPEIDFDSAPQYVDDATRDILAEAEELVASLNELDADATEAERAAREANAAFDATPNASTHSASGVAARVAMNARARHTNACQDAKATLAQAQRIREIAELSDLQLKMNAAIAPAETERFKRAYLELLGTMRDWAKAVRDACEARNSLLNKVNALEGSVGLGVRHQPANAENAAAELNGELRELTGTRGDSGQPQAIAKLIEMSPDTFAVGVDTLCVLRGGEFI